MELQKDPQCKQCHNGGTDIKNKTSGCFDSFEVENCGCVFHGYRFIGVGYLWHYLVFMKNVWTEKGLLLCTSSSLVHSKTILWKQYCFKDSFFKEEKTFLCSEAVPSLATVSLFVPS